MTAAETSARIASIEARIAEIIDVLPHSQEDEANWFRSEIGLTWNA